MAGASLEEKRLKQLKQQLFGKEQPLIHKHLSRRSGTNHIDISSPSRSTLSSLALHPKSLRTDLVKIGALSFLALGIQFTLFFANHNGLIRLFQ